MRAHRIDGFVQVTGCAVKKMFPGGRAPEGVTVEVMARHGTQFNVTVKIIFLDHPSLHNHPRFCVIIGDWRQPRNPLNRVFFGFVKASEKELA
jgi:hypothetical protein